MQRMLALAVMLLCSISTFSQSALQVMGDTVRVRKAELIIENTSRETPGFLYNTSNGKTEFKRLRLLNIGDTAFAIIGQDTLVYKGSGSGKSVQFKVGSTGGPVAGDSIYINSLLSNGNIKVWKNGLFLYRDNSDGIIVDSIAGKITFRPALAAGDRVYIESLKGISLSFTTPPATGGFSTNLNTLYSGVRDNGDNTFTLRWATNNTTLSTSPRIVGLGSSTIAGYGLASPNRLGDKISTWLSSNTTGAVWINLGVAGYASANIMPTANGGTAGTNIDSALNSNPDFIFISLPSNDVANGLTTAQILANFRKLDTMALNRGIPIFWETTQPRTAFNATQQTQLKVLADSIRAIWPLRYVEGFSNTVNTGASTAAEINAAYAQADGVHLNAAGIQLIATSLFARWQAYFQAITGVSGYIVETSADGTTWTQLDAITDPTVVKKIYTRSTTATQYFRVSAQYTNQTNSAYSNTIALYPSTGTSVPVGSSNRILVDLGGDGTTTTLPDGSGQGQTTASPASTGDYWNNWYGSGGGLGFRGGAAINNLVTAANTATTVSAKIIGEPYGTFFNTNTNTRGINSNGATAAVSDYPVTAVSDNMFLYSSINPDGVILRLTGLSTSKTYTVKLWGARVDNTTTPRILETRLSTDAWSAAKTMESRYAAADTPDYERAITYTAITGKDSVDIYMRTGTGSTYASLSLLDIHIENTTTPTPSVQVRDTAITLPNSGLQLPGIVAANGTTISSYLWAQLTGPNTTTITNGTTATCTITGLTAGTFTYRLTVTTSTGTTFSDDATVTVSAAASTNKLLRVNFSNTAVTAVPGWFNAYGPVNASHVVRTDATTGWSIDNVSANDSSWSGFGGNNGADTIGAVTGNNSGIVPDLVLKSCWYNYSTKYTGKNNIYITGLDPAKTYTLQLVASRSLGAAAPKYGAWHVNGGPELLQNASNNTTLQTTVTGVVPDASGKIRLAVYAPDSAGTNGAFSYINALIITEQ